MARYGGPDSRRFWVISSLSMILFAAGLFIGGACPQPCRYSCGPPVQYCAGPLALPVGLGLVGGGVVLFDLLLYLGFRPNDPENADQEREPDYDPAANRKFAGKLVAWTAVILATGALFGIGAAGSLLERFEFGGAALALCAAFSAVMFRPFSPTNPDAAPDALRFGERDRDNFVFYGGLAAMMAALSLWLPGGAITALPGSATGLLVIFVVAGSARTEFVSDSRHVALATGGKQEWSLEWAEVQKVTMTGSAPTQASGVPSGPSLIQFHSKSAVHDVERNSIPHHFADLQRYLLDELNRRPEVTLEIVPIARLIDEARSRAAGPPPA